MSDTTSPVSKELLDILACPACDERPPLELVDDNTFLQCTSCKRKYPVTDGIPQLVIEEAVEPDKL